MRTSIVSRSVVALASVAIGSAALAAVPADAATASGITREQILTAAAGVRANPDSSIGLFGGGGYGTAANRALKSMVNRACSVDPDGPEVGVATISAATAAGGSAEGVVVTAYLIDFDASAAADTEVGRLCTFGALAPVAARSVLTGTATLTGAPTTALSGDAFVTPPVNTPFTGSDPGTPTFAASGNAIQSDDVKVKDKKTSKEKKAAKKKYAKRIAAAKKAYKKALDKAGSSKSKKAAAKKAYKAKRSAAKAAYRYAIANYKIVIKKTATPFSVSATYTLPS